MTDEARKLCRHRIAFTVLVGVAQQRRFLDLGFDGIAVGRGQCRLHRRNQRDCRCNGVPALSAKFVDHLFRIAGGAWSCRKKQDQSGFRYQLSAHVNRPRWCELYLCSRVAGPAGFDGPIPSEKVTTRNGLVTVAIVRTTCRNPMSITETELSKLFGARSNLPSPVSAWSRVSFPAPTGIEGSWMGLYGSDRSKTATKRDSATTLGGPYKVPISTKTVFPSGDGIAYCSAARSCGLPAIDVRQVGSP